MNGNVIAGRYELLEKIGDGGMAIVYKAKCNVLKRYVAVKILKPEFAKDAKFIENFINESHAAASLSHPNIVSVFDVGRDGNINYIVMELVNGETLSELIKRDGKLDYRRAIEITKQIASGLSAAHKNGIIHKDVKPHNILINEDGVAKLTDFGIARAVTDTTIVDSKSGAVMGSVHYFSPEQAKGGYVDEKSDIYSLGIVLFEMLTGRVPFDGDNPVTIALMQINEEITPPSAIVPGIPPRLEQIVLKATNKYPAKRFASAEDMIYELENIELVSRVVGASTYANSDSYRKPSEEKYRRTNEMDYLRDMADYEEQPGKKAKKQVSKKKNNKKKILIAVLILLVLVILAATVFAVTNLLGKKDVTVPDFTGMKYSDAKSKADSLNIDIEVGEYVYSKDFDKDEIADQDPEKGKTIKEGDTVVVDISKGTDNGVVPNVVGLTEDEAKKMIAEYGYKVGSIREIDSSEPKGKVLKQSPDGGEALAKDGEITITVSNGEGKQKVEVPNLIGMTEDEAEAALTAVKLKLGKVSTGVSETYNEDKIMWQEYDAGEQIDIGESVNIRVSQGKTSTINLYVDFADAKDEVFYVTITVSDDRGTRNVVTNDQKKKSDGGETFEILGTGKGSITVIFDDETVMTKSVNFASGDVS